MSTFQHYSVMLSECISALDVQEDGLYIDCTAGGGGHSFAIASKLSARKGGRLIAIDQDADAISACRERLAPFSDRIELVHDNFSNIAAILNHYAPDRKPNGVLIDLGISSYQIDTPERGFSYMHDAPLDMRMDTSAPFTAADLLQNYSEGELIRILYEWGEERFAPQIARAIVEQRKTAPITTTMELVALIRDAIPAKYIEKGSHPAKRTFQALRIEVNQELSIIEPTLLSLIEALAPGGRLAVLTFHSLEDRIVKQTFAAQAKGCTCPPDFPVCTCGKSASIRLVSKKPLLPSEAELQENPRSHSAKLRIAEKLSSSEKRSLL